MTSKLSITRRVAHTADHLEIVEQLHQLVQAGGPDTTGIKDNLPVGLICVVGIKDRLADPLTFCLIENE